MSSELDERYGKVAKDNGTLGHSMIEMNAFQYVSHILLAVIGLPLNSLIIIVILTSRRMNQKPRNILWLGVILSNWFTLLTVLFELLTFHYQSPLGCQIVGLLSGVAYTTKLYNLLLALMDRYVAIVYPFVHRRRITKTAVIVTQIIGAIVIFVIVRSPSLFCGAPLECGFSLVHWQIMAVTALILLIACIIFQFAIYMRTRHFFYRPDQSRVVSVSFVHKETEREETDRPSAIVNLHSLVKEEENERKDLSTKPSNAPLVIHGGGNRVMEIEATLSLLAGVGSLLVFTSPTVVMAFLAWGCHWIYGGEEHCSTILTTGPYCREFLLYQLVYNPIVYTIRSREFQTTLVTKCLCWFRWSSSSSANRGCVARPVSPPAPFVANSIHDR